MIYQYSEAYKAKMQSIGLRFPDINKQEQLCKERKINEIEYYSENKYLGFYPEIATRLYHTLRAISKDVLSVFIPSEDGFAVTLETHNKAIIQYLTEVYKVKNITYTTSKDTGFVTYLTYSITGNHVKNLFKD